MFRPKMNREVFVQAEVALENGALEPGNDEKIVVIDYTNHHGQKQFRLIRPESFFFGSTEYHPEPQHFVVATDLVKQEQRTFAMELIHSWMTVKHFVVQERHRQQYDPNSTTKPE